jgi:hypothetical protein
MTFFYRGFLVSGIFLAKKHDLSKKQLRSARAVERKFVSRLRLPVKS